MKKKKAVLPDVLVDEKQFDAVIAQLLKTPPMPQKKIKVQGRLGAKTQMFPPQKSES